MTGNEEKISSNRLNDGARIVLLPYAFPLVANQALDDFKTTISDCQSALDIS